MLGLVAGLIIGGKTIGRGARHAGQRTQAGFGELSGAVNAASIRLAEAGLAAADLHSKALSHGMLVATQTFGDQLRDTVSNAADKAAATIDANTDKIIDALGRNVDIATISFEGESKLWRGVAEDFTNSWLQGVYVLSCSLLILAFVVGFPQWYNREDRRGLLASIMQSLTDILHAPVRDVFRYIVYLLGIVILVFMMGWTYEFALKMQYDHEFIISIAQAKSGSVVGLQTHAQLPIGTIVAFNLRTDTLLDQQNALVSKGWAICNGKSTKDQGITGAILTTTPDLRGKFLEGATVEELAEISQSDRSIGAATLRIQSIHNGKYNHGPALVPLNGKSLSQETGHGMFGGKWENPHSALDFQWTNPGGPKPAHYRVVYVILVK